MNLGKTALLLVLLPLLQVGCALTKETIHINYMPQQEVSKIQGAEKVKVGITVKDRRADQTAEVARKMNGFGSEMAPISNDEAIPVLIENAIKEELLARGYLVGSHSSKLVIELLGFTHKFNTGFFSGDSKANISLLVLVRTESGSELFEKTFSDSYSHSIQIMTGSNVKEAYEKALPGVIKKLMDDSEFHAALAKSVLTSSKATGTSPDKASN